MRRLITQFEEKVRSGWLTSHRKVEIGKAIESIGFDGSRRFPRVGEAFGRLQAKILEHKIEVDQFITLGMMIDDVGTLELGIVIENEDNPWCPIKVPNAMLEFSWKRRGPRRFTVNAKIVDVGG